MREKIEASGTKAEEILSCDKPPKKIAGGKSAAAKKTKITAPAAAETFSAPGILYLCATPIGNLGDITYRAVATLGEVKLIAAEDTRHTRKLLRHYGITTPMISYHEHNKDSVGEEILERLRRGEDIAIVSDAGMPAIADPGEDIARKAVAANITVRVLPGANAALTALITSTLEVAPFTFIGFLPRTSKRAKEYLAEIAAMRTTLIFYEAPHRLRETLALMIKYFGGERKATLARELTKAFEEHLRSTLYELQAYYAEHEPRGEYVIVVAGSAGESAVQNEPVLSLEELYAAKLSTLGDKKEAMRQVARELGLSRRDVYKKIIAQSDRIR